MPPEIFIPRGFPESIAALANRMGKCAPASRNEQVTHTIALSARRLYSDNSLADIFPHSKKGARIVENRTPNPFAFHLIVRFAPVPRHHTVNLCLPVYRPFSQTAE